MSDTTTTTGTAAAAAAVVTVPEVGTRVQYMLSKYDADQINQVRTEHGNFLRSGLANVLRTGHVGHIGNYAHEGDIVAADIVRVFDETSLTVNLQLILDGNHGTWVTSRAHGFTENTWRYLGEKAPAENTATTGT